MGHYTKISFNAPLSEFGYQVVCTLRSAWSDPRRPQGGKDAWLEVSRHFERAEWGRTHDIFEEFAEMDRADFIPFGGCEDHCNTLHANAEFPVFDWRVKCALKNYGGEVEYFCEHVLPLLIHKMTIVAVNEDECEQVLRKVVPAFASVECSFAVTDAPDVKAEVDDARAAINEALELLPEVEETRRYKFKVNDVFINGVRLSGDASMAMYYNEIKRRRR